jgi:hypothetical protein
MYVLQLCVLTVDPMPTVPAAMRRMNTCVGVTMDTLETPQTTVMVSSGNTTFCTYTSRTNASHYWRVSANSNELSRVE